jgi:serine/threonine-protein kinase
MLRIRHLAITAAVIIIGGPLLPNLCVAQSAGNKAAAEAIFEQGKLLMQSGDYQQACVKLEASRKLDEGIGTMLYLADCYEKVGRTASAWALFKEAASIAGAQNQDSRQKLATQRARALEPGLVKLTIDVAQKNESLLGFEVRNDGITVPPAQYGAPVPVDPGEHRIEASAPGKRSYNEVVTVQKDSGHISMPLLTDLTPP